MDTEDRALLRGLLKEERLLALAVVVDGDPVAGLLPFVVAREFEALYVQASTLARHTRGLVEGARFSAVIHRPDSPEADALQTPRVTLEGKVGLLDPEGEARAAVRAMLEKFPSAAMTLALPDFTVYRLELRGGRLIGGFGSALALSSSHFADLARQ